MGDNGGHFHHPSKAFDRVETEYEEFSPNDMTMERRNGVQATGGMCPPRKKNFIGSFFGSIASIFTLKSKKKGEPTIVSDPGGVNASPDGGVTNSKTGTLASTFSTLRDKLFNPKHRGPRKTRRKKFKKPRMDASSINVDDIQKAGEVDKQNRVDLPPKTFIEEGNSDAIYLPDIRGTENVESFLPFHDSIADFGHQGSFAEMGEARGSTLSFATGLSPSQRGKTFQPNSPSFKNRRRDNAAAKKQFGNFLKTNPVPTATVQLSPMSSVQGSQKSNVSKPTARPLTSNTNDSAEKRYSLDGKLDLNRESKSRDHEMHIENTTNKLSVSVSKRKDLPQVPPPAPEKTPKRDLPQVPPRVVHKQQTIEGPDMPAVGVDDRSKIDSGITFGILDPTTDRRSAMTEFEPDLGSSGNLGRKKNSNQEVLPKVQTKNQKPTEVPPTPSLDQFMLPQGSNRKVSEVPEDVLLPSPNLNQNKKSPGVSRNSFAAFAGILSSSKHSKKLKKSQKKKSKNKQQDKFEEVDVPPSPYLPNSPSGSFLGGSPVSSLNGPSDRRVSDIGDDPAKSLSSSKRGGMFAFDFLTSKRKKKEKQLEDISRREKKGDNELSVNTDML